MKAEKIQVLNGPTFVVVHGENPSEYLPDTVITLDGGWADAIANGLVKMINERCPECGAFNGLHGAVFVMTGQYEGEVQGHSQKCSRSVEVRQ